MKTKNLLKVLLPVILVISAGLILFFTMGIPGVGPVNIWGEVSPPLVLDNGHIIMTSRNGEECSVHIIDFEGNELPNSPYWLGLKSKWISGPALLDVDGDGEKEIIVTYIVINNTLGLGIIKQDLTGYEVNLSSDYHAVVSPPLPVTIDDNNKGVIIARVVKESNGEKYKFIVDGKKLTGVGPEYIESLFMPSVILNETIDQTTLDELISKNIDIVSQLAIENLPEGSMVKPDLIKSLLGDDLCAYYKFDEGADDFSNNLNNLENNGVSFEEKGKIGNAAKFDGNSFLEILDGVQDGLDTTGNMTVACWVRLNSLTGHSPIVSKYDSNPLEPDGLGRSYELAINSFGTVNWVVSNNGTDAHGGSVAPSNIVVGQWYHIAAVRDGGLLRVYVNGTEITEPGWPNPYPYPAIYDSSAPFRIGSTFNHSNYFDGLIDEVVICKKALTEPEIKMLAEYKEKYPAYGPGGVAFTIHTDEGARLVRIAPYKDPTNMLRPGFLMGDPITGESMGAPVSVGNSIVVLGKKVVVVNDTDYIVVRKVTQNAENTNIQEYEEPIGLGEIVKCGQVSVFETGKVVAPWHIKNKNNPDAPGFVGFLLFNVENLSKVDSDEFNWPFDTRYLKIDVAELTVSGTTGKWLLFANQAKSLLQLKSVLSLPELSEDMKLSQDECCIGHAVADLDGDGFNDVVSVTNMGYLYISHPAITPPPVVVTGTLEIQDTPIDKVHYYPTEGLYYTSGSGITLILKSGNATHFCIKQIKEGQVEGNIPYGPQIPLENGEKSVSTTLGSGDGKYTIYAKFIKGNSESEPVSKKIILDIKKPDIKLDNIKVDASKIAILCQPDYTIKGTVTDVNLDVIHFYWFYNGPNGYNWYNIHECELSSVLYTDGKFEIQLINLKGGYYNTKLYAQDKAGNYIYAYPIKFTYQKPDLIIKKAYVGTTFGFPAIPAIKVTIDNVLATSGYYGTYSTKPINVKCILYKWTLAVYPSFSIKNISIGTYSKIIEPGTMLPNTVSFSVPLYYTGLFTGFSITVNEDGAVAEGGFKSINNNTGFVGKNTTYEYTPPVL